jgi:hypothetical protein
MALLSKNSLSLNPKPDFFFSALSLSIVLSKTATRRKKEI